ncbi:uncharacterized protein [Arachis hypogaea]|uniref:uncharacterized protein n=1 Tax=Arachis hypogaea TaxID=3818 RepID=UPI003B214E89
MAWRDGCTVQILQHGRFFIVASVLIAGSNDPYGVLVVYLSSNDQHRMAQFAELTSVTQQFNGKMGGAKSPSSIETFNSLIDDNSLINIGMVGRPFTWSNRRRSDELIQERLDRFLVGVDWQQLYPNATILRLSELGSDHSPLLLDSNPRTGRSRRRFKFQERWCSNDEIRKIVREVWHEQLDGSAMYILAQKIKRCQHKIVRWQQEHRSNSKVEIDLLKSELEELYLAGIHGDDIISEIEDKLEKALQNEKSYWKDKSRVKWLKFGDQNTTFFHHKFRNRNRRNKIWQLTGSDGEVATSNASIASVAEYYFKDIFSSTCHENLEPLFTDFEPKVTAHMNRRLQRPVNMEAVKCVTFSIHPQSALEDDGMIAKFFQNFWNILRGDVFRAVKSFFSGGRILKGFNHTQICLIPKISDAKDMTQAAAVLSGDRGTARSFCNAGSDMDGASDMSGDCAQRLDGRGPPFLADLSPLLHPWTTAMLTPFSDDDGADNYSNGDRLHSGDDDGDRNPQKRRRTRGQWLSPATAVTASGGGGATVAGCPSGSELSPSSALFSSL